MSVAVWSSLGAKWIRFIQKMGLRPPAPSVAENPPAESPSAEGGEEPPVEASQEGEKPEPENPAADQSLDIERRALHEELAQSFAQTVIAEPPHAAKILSREQTLASLDGLQQLPSLKSLVQGFVKISASDEATVGDVVASIQRDPALCIRLLTMANSAVVSSEQKVDDLDTAVHLLGAQRVRRLQKAFFTLKDSRQLADGLDWRHLWIHALATGAIAEELDVALSTGCGPQLYLAGLLHDVGKIALSTVAADSYRGVLVDAWFEKGQLEDLEKYYLGIDHREAGWIFTLQNKLPEVVIESAAFHNDPSAAVGRPLEVALVSVANYLSKAFGLGFSGSRLRETDGELVDLKAWKIIEERTGRVPDFERLEAHLRKFSTSLRAEFRGVREIA